MEKGQPNKCLNFPAKKIKHYTNFFDPAKWGDLNKKVFGSSFRAYFYCH